MNTARASFLALTLCWSSIAAAQVPIPPLIGRVTDQTGTLTVEQKAALEQTLTAFETRKGSQIAVVIVSTTESETIEQYAFRIAEQWRLGRKKTDDGAVLVVAKTDRALRIEVGYGLEGALNDATSKRIISEIMVPRFKQGDFYIGITAGVDQIIRVIDGEQLPEPKGKSSGGTPSVSQYVPIMFLVALVAGGVLQSVLGVFPGALVAGGAVALIAWLFVSTALIALVAGAIALFVTLLGGVMGWRGSSGLRGGSGRGGFGGGGFSRGGFSSGGFSGGGGGFGGGGASGRW